jgi:transcriptional regulator with XRE-family HTH domain
MYSHPQRLSDKLTKELRNEAGLWLRELREKRGLSQRDLAAKVGAEYYTFISQLETGRGRIPPDRYLAWANALEIAPQEFVHRLMSYYDPVTYGILFGQTSAKQPIAARAKRSRSPKVGPQAGRKNGASRSLE